MTFHKYRAKPKVVDGIRFSSTKESKRYQQLKILEAAGEIEALEIQPEFKIEINGMKVCRYIGDFKYREKWGEEVVEDVKGMKSGAAYQMFRLKKKLVKALHKIEIREV